ncbi:MAG: hypothetical protein ACJA2S_000463 [Cyclobacteriaceae bacterium]|jgi:hypothetical protein
MIVKVGPELLNLLISAWITTVIVPVLLTTPNIPPIRNIKKIMSPLSSSPLGIADKKAKMPTGVAFPSICSPIKNP